VKHGFDILRCISIGLILGVSLLHMLPEANGMLEEAGALGEIQEYVNETAAALAHLAGEEEHEGHEEHGHAYPYAFLFASLGVCLMLLLEQIAESLSEKPPKKEVDKADGSVNLEAQKDEHEGHTHAAGDLHSHHDATLANAEDKMKAYAIEGSIALHSVLIGVGLGVLTEYANIEILLVALCFHQLFEGIALGGAVVKANQSRWFLAGLILCFSLSCPIGVAIGAGISDTFDENSSGLWTQGVLYSFACGTLLYIGLYDLMAQSFQKRNQGPKKFVMVFAVFVGMGLMALLAVWA